MDTIRVAVMGACGRMGTEVVQAVTKQNDMSLVLAVDKKFQDQDVGTVTCDKALGVPIHDRLTDDLLSDHAPTVLLDFTVPTVAVTHAVMALRQKITPIIGTSGLSKQELSEVRSTCDDVQHGALFIPNFAIGAVLMMRFAQEAARYLPDAEIIEMHHDSRLESPTPTATRTAEAIMHARKNTARSFAREIVKLDGARGAELGHVKIHSVRLNGLVAHQMVVFGGMGEVLTIRHDSTDRQSYMPGVLLAIRKAPEIRGLVCGLDTLL